MSELYVLTVYKNLFGREEQGKFMLRNFKNFQEHMINSGAYMCKAEIDVGKGLAVTDHFGYDLQLLSSCPELWNKDRALNLLIKQLPASAEYIAWTDSDIHFCNPYWVEKTIQYLQDVRAVQLFSHTQDLSERYAPIGDVGTSWSWRYLRGLHGWQEGSYAGIGWAFRRETLEKLYPFPDWIISGQADTDAALAFIGNHRECAYSGVYAQKMQDWIDRAYRAVAGHVSHIPGFVLHHWHGPRYNRGYDTVNRILVDHQYNPDTDIEVESSGLYKFSGKNPLLEKALLDWYHHREGM